ncbi:MAG: flagellar hook-length control protein FliK [Bacillaceae bacterium]|nr:flagellar hook-length control protein FliK [Bacillaceae bacterium]
MFSSSVLTGLLQHLQSSEGKIRLIPGQIFKGTVLKLLPQNTAQVRIGGLTIHAVLQAPLQVGQQAWMQVQPGTTPVTLRVVEHPGRNTTHHKLPEPTTEGLLKVFSLPDNKLNRTVLDFMIQEQIPVTKERIQQIATVFRDQGISLQTKQTLLMALQRELPLTGGTMQALHTFLHGGGFQQQVDHWLKEARSFLTSSGVLSGQRGEESGLFQPESRPPAAGQVSTVTHHPGEQVMSAERGVMKQPEGQSAPSTYARLSSTAGRGEPTQPVVVYGQVHEQTGKQGVSGPNHHTTGQAEKSAYQMGSLPPIVPGTSDNTQTNRIGQTSDHAPAVTGSGTRPVEWVGRLFQLLSGYHRDPDPFVSEGRRTENPTPALSPIEGAKVASHSGKEPVIKSFYQELGMEHEKNLLRMSMLQMGEPTGETGRMQLQTDPHMKENVKHLLLKLVQSDADIPVSLRESSQNLLNHITGQQLMMHQSQDQAIIQLLLQIPFFFGDGNQATVQMESRQTKNGGVDPENCRMLFHLDMEHLGETVMDVQIVNKQVTMKIYTEHDQEQASRIENLIRDEQKALEENLKKEGYQLVSIQHKFRDPEQATHIAQGSNPYSFSSYQGVDIRI